MFDPVGVDTQDKLKPGTSGVTHVLGALRPEAGGRSYDQGPRDRHRVALGGVFQQPERLRAG